MKAVQFQFTTLYSKRVNDIILHMNLGKNKNPLVPIVPGHMIKRVREKPAVPWKELVRMT